MNEAPYYSIVTYETIDKTKCIEIYKGYTEGSCDEFIISIPQYKFDHLINGYLIKKYKESGY